MEGRGSLYLMVLCMIVVNHYDILKGIMVYKYFYTPKENKQRAVNQDTMPAPPLLRSVDKIKA